MSTSSARRGNTVHSLGLHIHGMAKKGIDPLMICSRNTAGLGLLRGNATNLVGHLQGLPLFSRGFGVRFPLLLQICFGGLQSHRGGGAPEVRWLVHRLFALIPAGREHRQGKQ